MRIKPLLFRMWTRPRMCVQFAEAVVNLKFDEEPKYQAFMALFDPLCGPQPQRPILTDGQSKALLQQPYLPGIDAVRFWIKNLHASFIWSV